MSSIVGPLNKVCRLKLNARLPESSSSGLPNITSDGNEDSYWKCYPESKITENPRNCQNAAV